MDTLTLSTVDTLRHGDRFIYFQVEATGIYYGPYTFLEATPCVGTLLVRVVEDPGVRVFVPETIVEILAPSSP